MQAMPRVGADADVLLLYGDVPLVRTATLKRLLEAAREGLALLTAELDDPAAYGRIVRDASGRVKRIVEQRDASPAERAIREINAGFYALSAQRLSGWLKKIDNRNAQKEYYLTDLVGPCSRPKACRWSRSRPTDAWEAAGVNSKARARRARAAVSKVVFRKAHGSRRNARRSGAHRRARHARLRARRGDRRELRVRGPGHARRRRAHRPELRVEEHHRGGGHARSWRSASGRFRDWRALPHRSVSRGCVPAHSSPKTCTSATSSR